MAKEKKSKKTTAVNKDKKKDISNTSFNSSGSGTAKAAVNQELIFGKQNYLFIAAAFGLILLGMLLMMGGDMPDSNTWDESLIYSTRRTLIAPIVILIGLVVGVFAIFRD